MRTVCTSTIAIVAMLWGCGVHAQKSRTFHDPLIVRDSNVLDVLSARTALILHSGKTCLYDIRGKYIVEEGYESVEHSDGYVMTQSLHGKKKRYRLYDQNLEPIREWTATSSRILADGYVSVEREGRWDLVAPNGKVAYRSHRSIFFAQLPFLVLDSASVLFDTRLDKSVVDSVEMLFRWGKGAIIEAATSQGAQYTWLDFTSERRVDLGNEILSSTASYIVFRDSNKTKIVYDTNMNVRCRSDKYILECSDIIRVEYSQSARTWCFIDLVGSDTRCGYDGVQPDGSGCYIVSKDRKWGLLRYDGKVIIPITHPILPDKSRNSHVSVTTLPSYRGDNVIKFYTSDWKVSYYYYDINGYSRLFPD